MNRAIQGFLLFIAVLAVSCGIAPPKEMKAQLFLDFLDTTSDEIVDSFNDFSALDLLKPYWLPNPLLWHFPSSQEILFEKSAFPSEELDDSVMFALNGNGEIVLNRNFYFTAWGKTLVYSFDKIRWFALDGDPREYEAFVPDIRFRSQCDGGRLHFRFTWAVREGNSPKPVPLRDAAVFSERKEISLLPNQVCYSTDKNDRPVDLHSHVFFVPNGTKVAFKWDFDCNFLQLHQLDGCRTVLKPLKDLWFYRKNRIISLGFDGKNYGDTFFSYRFAMKQSVTTDDTGYPTVCQRILLVNKKFPHIDVAD